MFSNSACQILSVPIVCAGLLLSPAAFAQPVPPGFEIVRLTFDQGIHSVPDINDRGDVVWSSSLPPSESDIYLYRDGQVEQVTNDAWYNVNPTMNANADIAWMRAATWSPPFHVAFDYGTGPQAVPDPGGISAIGAPEITDDRLIVWSQRLALGPSVDEIFSYDGRALQQLTKNGLSNQGPRLNRFGDMAWTRYDFRVTPWTSTIMLNSNEQIFELTSAGGEPQVPDVNDRLQVVWQCSYGCSTLGIHLWDAGQTTVITEDGRVPRMNNGGEVVFFRWNEGEQRWRMWLYRAGRLRQFPDMGYEFGGARINDSGEIAWREFMNSAGETAIFLMRRVPAQTLPVGNEVRPISMRRLP